jgi:MerR HTH family regulatory protein
MTAMPTRSRTGLHGSPLDISLTSSPLAGEIWLSREQLAAAVGISPAKLARLIRLGLVEPTEPGPSEFAAAVAARVRRMLRLHDDLGVDLVGAAIIADLLERLDHMETELRRLRGEA